MKNADSTAFPIFDHDGHAGVWNDGLTKREYFAAVAMQGLCANLDSVAEASNNSGDGVLTSDYIVRLAVDLSDGLIEALEK